MYTAQEKRKQIFEHIIHKMYKEINEYKYSKDGKENK